MGKRISLTNVKSHIVLPIGKLYQDKKFDTWNWGISKIRSHAIIQKSPQRNYIAIAQLHRRDIDKPERKEDKMLLNT